MPSGGLRENAGRKKIGVIINTRIEEQLIEQIDLYIHGLSRADKIRKCLQLGINQQINSLASKINESNSATVSKFFKVYMSLLDDINQSEQNGIEILNDYLLGFFTSDIQRLSALDISKELQTKIIKSFQKFSWSLDEYDNSPNLITPSVIGAVIEKVVNQKETGSYYTPRDTTNYIAEYSLVFSMLCKFDLPELAYLFYEQYSDPSNLAVLNAGTNPIEKLASAINQLSQENKRVVFDKILEFTIIDPTCGTGAFIVAAADILVELYKLTNMYLYISLNDFVVNIFRNCLFGVDILDTAISLIQLRSKLYLYNLGISHDVVSSISFQFYCGDSLVPVSSNIKTNIFIQNDSLKKIIDIGGFDCVIGNPPYIESAKAGVNIDDYGQYETRQCGNLYAFIFENSLQLLKDNSYMGLIVPISITSTQRMDPLRKLLFSSCETVYISNFSDRPACLFAGVHQKLSIVFIKKTRPLNGCKIYTSGYKHWSKDERLSLFDSITYYRATKDFIDENAIAKIGDETKQNILKKVLEFPMPFSAVISKTSNNNKLFINQRMTFWAKCFSKPESSKEYKEYCIVDNISNKAVAALLNSSLYFLLWETYSDCWHITQNDLQHLRFPQKFFDDVVQKNLTKLETALETKLYDTREYIYSKQTDYIYIHRKCYKEITAINNYLAEVFNFTEQEKIYIQEYNANYRLSVSKALEEQ